MAQIELRLSSNIQKDTGRSELLIRLFQGSKINFRGKTGIFISPSHFEYYIDKYKTEKLLGLKLPLKLDTVTVADSIKRNYILLGRGKIVIKNRIKSEEVSYHLEQIKKVNDLKRLILDSFEAIDKEKINSDWLKIIIDKYNHPEKYVVKAKEKLSFFTLFEEYIQKQQMAYDQIKGYHVLIRILCRYEKYKRIIEKKNFKIDVDTISKGILEDFRNYIRYEKSFADEHPKIFENLLSRYPLEINIKQRSPKLVERGNNTVIKLMKKFKTFFNWLNKQGITSNHPFEGITIGTETYGTPIYITLDERNKIADFDFSGNIYLEKQRDIFIFQCLIGCRVGDLVKMAKGNIINDAIEYIPHKTKEERPKVIRVPFNERAKALVEKYDGNHEDGRLFPFISPQKYNEAIKAIFTACGVVRMVTVLNPTTGEEEKVPINKVASSHMARRTFVGNLYKRVKDPNLVGTLSGHAEGSKAFARYRDIDEEMKKELVDLIK